MIKFLTAGLISVFAVMSLYSTEAKPSETKKKCDKNCCPNIQAQATPTESKLIKLKRDSRPDNAEVYFVSPKDGDVITGDVKVIFGLVQKRMIF